MKPSEVLNDSKVVSQKANSGNESISTTSNPENKKSDKK